MLPPLLIPEARQKRTRQQALGLEKKGGGPPPTDSHGALFAHTDPGSGIPIGTSSLDQRKTEVPPPGTMHQIKKDGRPRVVFSGTAPLGEPTNRGVERAKFFKESEPLRESKRRKNGPLNSTNEPREEPLRNATEKNKKVKREKKRGLYLEPERGGEHQRRGTEK